MTLNYQLSEEDYINYNMYLAATSDAIKKLKGRSRLLLLLLFILISSAFYYFNRVMGIVTMSVSIVAFLLFPLLYDKLYLRTYRSMLTGKFAGKTGIPILLQMDTQEIHIQSNGGEQRIPAEQVANVTDISTLFIVRLKTGDAIIIARKGIADIATIQQQIQQLAATWQVPYIAV